MMEETKSEGMVFRKLNKGERVESFDCGEKYRDLNDFIVNDAPLYREELLAVTFVVGDEHETFAYFSLANDRVGIEDFPNNTLFNRFRRNRFVNAKRIKHYPAVKICRFAVSASKQFSGLGSRLIDLIKQKFLDDVETGCRYLTVDAKKDAIPFYRKNGFKLLSDSELTDSDSNTCLMFYDLMQLKII